MPKNKTHSGTAKRVKITGSGKLRRQQTRLRHRLEVKSSTVTRRQSGTVRDRPGRRQAGQEASRPLTVTDPATTRPPALRAAGAPRRIRIPR